MTFLINPFWGGASAKTEAEFNAHIATLATSGAVAWTTNAVLAAGHYRTTAAAVGGLMYASSWNDSFAQDAASPCRIIQHACQDQDVFDTQVANGQQVFFRILVDTPKIVFTSVNRNGYASLSFNDGSDYVALYVQQMIRWDRAASKAYTSDPGAGSVETEYTW